MNKEKEIEVRNNLTIDEYFSLCSFYLQKVGRKMIHIDNTNYYFDTDDFSLTKNDIVLRLRLINGKNPTLTLKIKKSDNECTEISEQLNHIQLDKLLNNNIFPSSDIFKELNKYSIYPSFLSKKGKLKNVRFEIKEDDCLIVLDKNEYNNKIDYDIEIEASSEKRAKEKLDDILKTFNIKKSKEYIVKSKRAMGIS